MSQPSQPSLIAPSPGPAAQPVLSALNAGAIAVAALYLGRELFIPLVLAVLLAFVLAPLVTLLQRAWLPKAAAVMVAVLLAFIVISSIGLVVGRQLTSLAQSLPAYDATIQQKVKSLAVGGEVVERFQKSVQSMFGSAGLGSAGLGSAGLGSASPTAETGVAAPATGLDPASALLIVRTVVAPVLGPLATLGVVVVFVIFVLMAREDLRDRLVRLVGRQDLHRTILAMNDAARRLSRYFLIQLALNTSFGAFIATGLWYVGLPSPLLWGILAALMRFVPFIGTFIAVLPPLLLALAVAPGWSMAVIVLGLFSLSELVMGQAVEPLLYGQSTGLSPIAVIVATAFWGFLWGPVGLLIATPLTVCLVVVGRHVTALTFLDVMLGDGPPLEPAETFYQRALEGNGKELAAQARARVRQASAAEYFDHVALPGLALAQADLARDTLAFERLEAIHHLIKGLLTSIAHADRAKIPPTSKWREDGAVLCIPCRGQLDDLAAAMAMQVLQGAGFGAQVASNMVLGSGREAVGLDGVRLCCLSVLEQGSSPSGVRYLLRRIERQMPNAAVVVGLWHASGDSPMLAALRSEGRGETIVLSLGELVALARAISARPSDLGAIQPLGSEDPISASITN